MGLLLDKNGIPLTYKLFPGNTNDVSYLVSFIDEAKKEFKFRRSIIVANAGILSGENIKSIMLSGNGYIFKQSINRMNASLKKTFDFNIKPDIEKLKNEHPDNDLFYKGITINNTKEFLDSNGKKKRFNVEE